MAFFTINNKYNVWERKGLYVNRAGLLSVSENDFTEGEVTPDQDLTYLGKKVEGFVGQHCVKLPDGRLAIIHRNHVDENTTYNIMKIARRLAKASSSQRMAESAPDQEHSGEVASENDPGFMALGGNIEVG